MGLYSSSHHRGQCVQDRPSSLPRTFLLLVSLLEGFMIFKDTDIGHTQVKLVSCFGLRTSS